MQNPTSREKTVERATENLPQGTATPYFEVVGRCLLTQVVGEVTTVIQTQANNTKLTANPTVGADVDLCAVNDITADAVGTFYTLTGVLADAMVPTTSGAAEAQSTGILVTDGSIDLSCAASNTGATKWTVHYIPLDAGSAISVA